MPILTIFKQFEVDSSLKSDVYPLHNRVCLVGFGAVSSARTTPERLKEMGQPSSMETATDLSWQYIAVDSSPRFTLFLMLFR
ncbi:MULTISPECIES: hypothetical protein [Desulfosediminicola]|uniref:hypothetical protein n=1 Tax=Desulfosediminicola TaxID=2886823 RepID=UPI001593520B|nr:hypothetical protein [Desulfosediminicola ganghwensis]